MGPSQTRSFPAEQVNAAREQSLPPGHVDVVDVDGPDLSAALDAAARVARRRPEAAWIWLLDSTGVPERDALAEELAVATATAGVGVVGAKQVRRDGVLLNVGLRATRAGRPLPGVELDELDQGQRDGVRHVQAVSRPGMLVRADLLDHLAAGDPTLRGVVAELDLGRRVHRAGRSVLMAPGARVVRETTDPWHDAVPAGGEPMPPSARGQITHYRLIGEPFWKLPWVVTATLLGALGRVVLGFAAADTVRGLRSAGSALNALGHPVRVFRGRRTQPRTARLPGGLRVPRRQALRYHLDRGVEARRREISGPGVRHDDPATRDAPCHAEPRGRPAAPGRIATLAPVVTGVLLLTFVAFWGLMSAGRVAGAAMPALPDRLGPLVAALGSSWRDVGLGQEGVADPVLQPLAVLSAVTFGRPGLAVRLVLLLAPGLAAATGWWLASALRTPRGWKVLAAVSWAATPAFLLSLASGRLGSAFAHLGVGACAAALVSALGATRRRATWAFTGMGGLAAWLAVAGAPVLVLPLAILLGGVALWARRPHPWVMLLPAVVAVAPLWLTRPAAVVVEPGTPVPTGRFYAWMALVGWPQGPRTWVGTGLHYVGYVSGSVPLLVALASLGLAATRRRGAVTVRWGLGAALAGLITAAVLSFTTVGVDAAGTRMRLTSGWPAPGISLAVLGLLIAGLVACPGGRALSRAGARRRPGRGPVLAVAACTVPGLVGLAGWAATMHTHRPAGSVTAGPAPVPAAAAAQANSEDHTRILFVRPTAAATDDPGGDEASRIRPRLSLLRGDGPRLDQTAAVTTQDTVHRTRHRSQDAADAALDQAFANVLLGSVAAPAALGPFGIGSVVVVDSPGAGVLVGRLTNTSGLVPEGRVASMQAFRVTSGSGDGFDIPDRPAALRLVGGARAPARQALAWHQGALGGAVTTQVPDRSTTATVETSTRYDDRWRAELDGRSLSPVRVHGWEQGFVVPPGSRGTVRIHRDEPFVTVWLLVLASVLAAAALLALPLRGTRG